MLLSFIWTGHRHQLPTKIRIQIPIFYLFIIYFFFLSENFHFPSLLKYSSSTKYSAEDAFRCTAKRTAERAPKRTIIGGWLDTCRMIKTEEKTQKKATGNVTVAGAACTSPFSTAGSENNKKKKVSLYRYYR